MKEKFRYVKKEDRKKILLLCDDIRMHSGIATMAREIVVGTSHHFNWVNLGAAINHPEAGKGFDISAEVNNLNGIQDADVKVLPNNGYGDTMQIRALIAQEKPDAVFIFTDPRYWVWLFEIERELRNEIPLMYLTMTSVEDLKLLDEFKKDLFQGKDIEFVAFFNSRNIRRKSPGDVILSYRMFCDLIGEEKAKKCALVMHTQAVDENGTDLLAVREAICDDSYVNVFFSQERLGTAQMNLLYNIADVGMLITSNEGWGLSLTETMMAGRMIIANVTGGMQDQMRFTDENGKWIDFSSDFPSNHRGTYKEHGEWAVPVFPSNISMVGSVPTPYIYDDRCAPEDVAKALEQVYNMGKEERNRRGAAAREWVTSDESGMSARQMCENVIDAMDETFEKFTPRSRFDLFKVTDRPKKYITHKLIY